MVGNGTKSAVTAIELAGGFDADAAYVGDVALDAVDWDKLDAWSNEWGRGGSGDGGDAAPSSEHRARPSNGAAGENGVVVAEKASAPQWKELRGLLDSLNYATVARQNAAIDGAGYDHERLAPEHASELIARLKKAASKK